MKRSKLLLEPLQKRALYLTTAVLWVSGAAWLYVLETDPSRPLWMRLHGAAAMVFLLIFGSLLAQHVPVGWQQADQRPSGGSLIVICSLLAVSGWVLYYFGNEELRHWTSLLHRTLGLILPAVIAFHVWLANKRT